MFMPRRTDIERKLTELGWVRGERSGNHRIWRHAASYPIYVPLDDLIERDVAAAILKDAEG